MFWRDVIGYDAVRVFEETVFGEKKVFGMKVDSEHGRLAKTWSEKNQDHRALHLQRVKYDDDRSTAREIAFRALASLVSRPRFGVQELSGDWKHENKKNVSIDFGGNSVSNDLSPPKRRKRGII